MDDDTDTEKDDAKRKSRNLSEKKRRDQFNLLVNELSSMVTSTNRKMDKSTVLKSTIAYLKQHNEIAVRSRVHEIQEDWKPSFLSNEEFSHLILEALDGFIIVFSTTGQIYYASESITSLLGHLPSDLLNMTIYDLAYEEDHSELYNLLSNPSVVIDPTRIDLSKVNQICFSCHLKRGGVDYREDVSFELVQFVGYFRNDIDIDDLVPSTSNKRYISDTESKIMFVGTTRIQTPQLIREMSVIDSTKSEFTSRHSLEWKFLFLDHRAPPIIGYLPFEVLGTSGYDYYHFDDLEKVVMCHEALMQKGEGTSCYYRFLTKGQQWIWLQTRFYITYHQWNSKPEFVVCTHRIISYSDVMKQLRNQSNNNNDDSENIKVLDESTNSTIDKHLLTGSSTATVNSPWSSISSRISRFAVTPVSPTTTQSRDRHQNYDGNATDSMSIIADSPASKNSLMTQCSSRSKRHSQQHHHRDHQQQNSKTNTSHTENNISIQLPQASIHAQHIIHPPQQTDQIGQHISLGSHQSTQMIPQCIQPTPQMLGSTFIDPSQYLAAIPVQPVLPSGFPSTAAVISSIQPLPELLHPSIVMTSTQSHIQDQLQRKHEELQQLIVQQQEELRRVSEQLLMARYGLLPSIVNVAVPLNPIDRTPSRTSQSHGNITSTSVNPNGHQSIQIDNNASNANNQLNHCTLAIEQIDSQGNIQSHNDEIISYMDLPTTSNVASLEHSIEQNSTTSLHEHQRQHSHERRSRDSAWDSTPSQQVIQMQSMSNSNIQVSNLTQNSHLQIDASNNSQQMQRDGNNTHIPSTVVASTTPAITDDLNILPYQIVQGQTQNIFPSTSDDNL